MSEECISCELLARRDRGEAPTWDNILRTDYFDVVHVIGGSLAGWIVLVLRRHVEAIDELTDEESVQLGRLLRLVSIGLKDITGCVKTYVMQFAEAEGHSHVHFHVVPRKKDIEPEFKGPNAFGYLQATENIVPDAERDKLALELRAFLEQELP